MRGPLTAVMAKENNPGSSAGQGNASPTIQRKKIGSASTWGPFEREKFKIDLDSVEYSGSQLIGADEAWWGQRTIDREFQQSKSPVL
jgi:hypothetical protein